MGKYTATSKINLEVNGKQASKIFNQLKKEAEDLRKKIDAAAKAGDKATAKKLQKELNDVNRLMKQMKSESATVADVLKRLDKATPKELQKTLSTLKRQLQDLERGSKAWERQIELIKSVKAEIDKVNESLKESDSRWSKMNKWLNDCQTFLAGAAAAVTGVMMAGRKAVETYAEMDQEMANVRKFTGMSAEGVEALNVEFQKIDTRTPREELNKLAQEAGRLGKSSPEDVLGFVRAADKINVALDDLGEGATLKLSKLTGIFGDEERLGTEQSLLAVGSVINELSQNCSASAPYIAEFTSRLGGVGSQAGLTVPKIMGYAAVLDSNNQKLEASSTALSQVMVRIYQEPQKYARVAGIDAAKFAKLVKTDMNEALILFLSTLNQAGGMDTLSPMFADMGENGSRAIAALSTLAGNIDKVVAQQKVANEAYREATSIDTEFNVQNNTVQASLEKAKNRFNELVVSLGEKLQPVMKYAISTTSMLVRVLDQVISFVTKNGTALASLTLAIAAYSAAAHFATIKTKLMTAARVVDTAILNAERAVLLLFSAATYALSGNLAKARVAMRAFSAAVASNPIGLVVTAIAALIPLIIKLCQHTETYTDRANKLIEKSRQVSEATMREQAEIDKLFGALKGAEKGSEQYLSVKNRLISQYGKYLSGLIDEKGEIINLAQAYDTLSRAVQRSAQLRGLTDAKEELGKQYYSEQTEALNLLRGSLKGYGASDMEAEQIITKVSMAMSSGKGIDSKTLQRIQSLSEGLPVADTKTGEKFTSIFGGKVAAWYAKNNLPFSKNATTPISIFRTMQSNLKDYRTGLKNIENMELGVNPSKNYDSDTLLQVLEGLDKIVESGETGAVSVPNLYAPESKKTMPLVLNEEGKKQWTKDQQKPLVYRPDASPQPASALGASGTDQFGLANAPAVSFQVQPLAQPAKKPRDVYSGKGYSTIAASPIEAKAIADQIRDELRLRGVAFDGNDAGSTDVEPQSVDPSGNYVSEKEQKKQEREARAAQIKARKEFKERLKEIKAEREKDMAEILAERSVGNLDYRKFQNKKFDIMDRYFKDSIDLYDKNGLDDDAERQELVKKRQELEDSFRREKVVLDLDAVKRTAALEERILQAAFNFKRNRTLADELKLQEDLMDIRYNALLDEQKLYSKGSKEYEDVERRMQDLLWQDQQDKKRLLLAKEKEFRDKFDKLSVKEKYDLELKALEELYKQHHILDYEYEEWRKRLLSARDNDVRKEKETLPGSAPETNKSSADKARRKYNEGKADLDRARDSGLIDDKEYAVRLRRLGSELNDALLNPLKNAESEWVRLFTNIYDAWKDFADALQDPDADPLSKLSAGLQATAALTGAVMSQVTEFSKIEYEKQSKQVEKRYDREIELAEGNTYLTKKLEKQKQKELDALKAEEAKKNFAMQVIATIAQTAANAVQAYGAGLSVGGPAGLVLAPIAAALAVAQGAVQIALLKKQQQAAESVGYSEGGFTRPGRKDDPAGVVHAGEWVASQKLVNSPQTRPLIDMLEYAQRNNTIGSISMRDVSRSVAAPMMAAYAAPQVQPVIVAPADQDRPQPDPQLSQVIGRLADRLDAPFVTVNSVTGDFGSLQAENRYKRMIANKSRRIRS